MKNEKKALLIVLIVAAATALVFAIKAIVGIYKTKNTSKQPKQETQIPTTSGDVRIGKTTYANSDNVVVLNSDFTIFKFAKNGEWVGKIEAIGQNNYIVSGGKYVLQADVTLQ